MHGGRARSEDESAAASNASVKGWNGCQNMLGLHIVTPNILTQAHCVISPYRDRKKEILSDERVQAAQKAGRGGRVRSEDESAAASSVTVVGKDDSRAQASPSQNGSKPAEVSSSLC